MTSKRIIQFVFLLILINGIKADFHPLRFCQPDEREKQCDANKKDSVCGWFKADAFCVNFPCVNNYVNECFACADKSVEKITEGKCPFPQRRIKRLNIK